MLFIPLGIFISSLLFWFYKPEVVQYIFLGNLWLFSYPHTFATFKRSYFENKKTKTLALVCVFSFVLINLAIFKIYDFVVLMNVYFYSQFFHYIRQNFGISKISSIGWNSLDSFLYHLITIAILFAFWKNDVSFFGYKLFRFDLPEFANEISLYLIYAIALYFVTRFKKISKMTYLFLFLSILLTYSSQVFILAWLGLHLFHNTQYLILSWKSNPRESFIKYYLGLVALTVIFYKSSEFIFSSINYIPITFCIILAVNYSHYFYDAFLWKRKYRLMYP